MTNREIKFRAWNNVKKAMEPAGDIEWSHPECLQIEAVCTKSFKMHYPNFELMQFTGLHDKNGKEIYEGDVLKIETNKPMLVGWSVKFASFVLNREGWAFAHWFGESCNPEDCEVIGNIHENPEFIK